MYPLVQYECRPQLNYITSKFIVGPIVENNFELFRKPNQYSILLMSFGYQFVTDQRFRNQRDQAPEEPLIEKKDARPFRYSIFARFAKELEMNHQDITHTD